MQDKLSSKMDTIKDIILELQELNAQVFVEGENLRVDAEKGIIGNKLKELIKANKQELIKYINEIRKNDFVTIPQVKEQPDYVLSSSQYRLWLLSQFEEANVAYNMPGFYEFNGRVDIASLERSFTTMIERHEILRTVLREAEGAEVRQVVLPVAEVDFRITYEDLRNHTDISEAVKAVTQAEARQPFDLQKGPLLRARLLQTADDKYVFCYVMHHIITDGWSMEVMIRELLLLYVAYSKGASNPLKPLRLQYKDYATWQQQQLSGGQLGIHKAYWLQQFEGELPVLELAGDRRRPSVRTYHGGRLHRLLNKDLHIGIKQLSDRQGATLFMGLLATVNALLYKHTGQSDIIIGSAIAGREHADLEDQIGFYLNTLALRTRFDGQTSFEDLLRKTQEVTLGGYEHQVYPFDELVGNLSLKRDMSRSALFDVMVDLQNAQSTEGGSPLGSLEELAVSGYAGKAAVMSRFDLTFNFSEASGALYVSLEYNSDIYNESSAAVLLNHFEQLLGSVIAAPEKKLDELSCVSAEETQQLLHEYNRTAVDYPTGTTLHGLFEEQVKRTPGQPALLYKEKVLTYEELNERANQLASYLRSEYEVEADDVIGIKLERSDWMLIAVLGILKSGGAYVPLDPQYPEDRINYMILDSGCKVVLDEEAITKFSSVQSEYSKINPQPVCTSSNLAYVIYTSGSTGRPKGVMIEHGSVVNYSWYAYNMYVGAGRPCNVGLFTSLSFDLTVTSIFPPLLNGHWIKIYDNETNLEAALTQSVGDEGIGLLKLTPAHISLLGSMEVGNCEVDRIIVGGEELQSAHVELLKRLNRDIEIYNEYGPTECTVGSIVWKVQEGKDKILIGRPIWNTQVYILDGHNRISGTGIPGEICLGGAGVGRGYMNNEEQTGERFIANPYKKGDRLYKTGDIGRWLADGNIEFMGRRDEQVKIRGYRIELGEIEQALKSNSLIGQAAVVVKADTAGNKRLTAYIVSKEALQSSELRTYLSEMLPVYMLPDQYVTLESMPLTVNGKIDRKLLLALEGSEMATGATYVAPRNETEEKLVQIWETVLGTTNIGVKADFFESGGHSLKAMKLSAQLYKEFKVKVPLRELFKTSVLEAQAELINKSVKVSYYSIPQAAEHTSYVLSSSQRRLWVLSQFEEANVAYNMPGFYEFNGRVDIASLERSFTTMIERHEILRTVLREGEGADVRQVVLPVVDVDFRITYEDLRDHADISEAVKAVTQAEARQPFDLQKGPLLRARLLQTGADKYVFCYVMHHIITDGWSMEVMIRELLLLYVAYSKGASNPLKPLRLQYKDYASWQQQQLSGGQLGIHKAYWLQQFEGELPVLELAGDRRRPSVRTYHGGRLHRLLNKELHIGIRQLSDRQGATLFMGLLATVNALLYKHTGQSDIIIGSAIAGREHADLEDQIGFYLNTLALRTRFDGQTSFVDLLRKTQEITLGGYEHQVYPFDELVGNLSLKRDMSRSALFDVMVDLQNGQSSEGGSPLGSLEDLAVSGYAGKAAVMSRFDLTFNFSEASGALYVSLEYNSDIYNESSAAVLLNHFEQLLGSVIAAPEKKLDELSCVSAEETQQLLHEYNSTAVDYPTGTTLHGLFEEQVKRTPGEPAVLYKEKVLTYEELNERANQLASYLRSEYEVEADDVIGIKLERSDWMLIAVLGILKSGGAYVPLDPQYPEDRINYMISDSGCKVVLDEDVLWSFNSVRSRYSKENAESISTSANLAYVIYTSGSTGRPKGVMIEHDSVVNYSWYAYNMYVGAGRPCNVGLFTSLSFDLTVTSIFPPLLNGHWIKVYDNETDLEAALTQSVGDEGIGLLKLTPAHINLLGNMSVDRCMAAQIIVGGEELQPAHVELLKRLNRDIEIYNEYGPTECTVGSIVWKVQEGKDKILIGRPIWNTQVYILDGHNRISGTGIPGEICLGGAGVGRGYMNNEEQTGERFIANPYKKGDRLYKTGDIGRWLADGNIEFMGRRDEQVKIRGYRIELGEIEQALKSNSLIGEAAVVVKADTAGNKRLTAYIVSKEALQSSELRTYLSEMLLVYMLPDQYVTLESMPLTVNGKIDRKLLLALEGSEMATGATYVAPRNETEEKLVLIWQEVLGKEKIGVKDNFFDLGGDSLKATRLASKLHKIFEVKVSLNDLFRHSALQEQAQLIAHTKKTSFITIPAVASRVNYPLSSSQHRLWVVSQLKGGNIAYNVPGVYVFEGQLNTAALAGSFNTLIARHEILRTIFKEDETTEVKQFVRAPEETGFRIQYHDLRAQKAQEQKVKDLVQSLINEPFDLSVGPLIRANLCQVADNTWIFTYNMHHIVSDGWSMDILINELLVLYNAQTKGENNPLQPLRIHYKDYAVWQQEQLGGERLLLHKNYWLKQFEGQLPVLELPIDKIRPAVKTYNGGVVSKRINPKLSKGLNALVNQQACTLFMGLLATVNTLLYRYTNQEDIIIGTQIAGREHADLEDQIGNYLNTLALRARFKGQYSFKELLETIKQVSLEAYEHQLYPFDELVEALAIRYDMGRNPLFDVSVVLQNTQINKQQDQLALGDIKVSGYGAIENTISKFDLAFDFIEIGEEIQVSIVYNNDIYHQSTVERFIDHLHQLLEVIIAYPDKAINSLVFLNDKELDQQVNEFNDTLVAYPNDKTIAALFEEQAHKTPDNVAIVFGDRILTYKELNEKSNQLAAYLIAHHNVQPNDLIAVMLDRSEMVLVAILGILKSGAAYVPIDPDYPVARKEFILKDIGARVLITQTDYIFNLAYFKGSVFAIDVQLDTINTTLHFSGAKSSPNDLAYVMYTSGSTGTPKGVMIEQRSVVRLVRSANYVDISADDKFLSLSSFSFDGSTLDIFGALLNGASVVIARKKDVIDIALLGQIIAHNKISIFFITTALFNTLADTADLQLDSVRFILFGGERVSLNHVRKFRAKYANVNLVHVYGPTENTTFSTFELITNVDEWADTIPIGKPISNSQCYIFLDKLLLPTGVVGEICVGGDGLSRGYLNNPELTTEKFISNPFKEGELIYKTGDLGRWLPNGRIVFMGRKDDQVKVRGHRIEPGEIESVLQGHQDIASSVVVAKINDNGEQELVAYVLSDADLNIADIRSYLSSQLPAYLIPAHFVQLDQFPLTSNGKVDKKKLPDPVGSDIKTGVEYVSPRNQVESNLVMVYEEVLKKQPIGIKEDFFALGGDSIKSIQVVSRLKQRGYSLNIQDIFLCPVIEELAACVRTVTRSIDQELTQGIIPLSPVQRFFLDSSIADKHHFNQSVLLFSKEPLSVEALQASLDKIVLHHDALRMVYRQTSNGWEQENKGKDQRCLLEVFDNTDALSFSAQCERIQAGFNLAEGPLFKAALFRGTDGERLLIIAHHLVIDGVSWRILFEDLSGLYQQYNSGTPLQLPLKTDAFKYWQQKQLEYAQSETLQKEETYWSAIDSQAITPLPLDYSDGSNLLKDAAGQSFLLNESDTACLLTTCYKAYQTDINDILLSALCMAIGEVFEFEKVSINLEGHGREDIGAQVDVTRTVGWFTTIYPVVFDMSHRNDAIRQLITVKETLHRVPNKGIGYGILRYLSGRDYKLTPEITFNYLGDFGSGVKTQRGEEVFEFSGAYHGNPISPIQQRSAVLDVSGMIVDGQLRVSIQYSTKQYSKTTIERLIAGYQQYLNALINHLSVEQNVYLTPVGLTYKDLSIEQVQELNADFRLEDVYPLSPLQEGMYYHWLSAPESPAYCNQLSYRLKGSLNIEALQKSYQMLVARHAILRTSFTQDLSTINLQVVKKATECSFIYKDIAAGKEFSIEDYKALDRNKGFDLHGGSQMRLTVLQQDSTYEFIWSFHHILMDGWCVGILIKEFFQLYAGLVQGKPAELNAVVPYASYIEWLMTQDKEQSLRYWKDYLAGYDRVGSLPKIAGKEKSGYQSQKRTISLKGSIRQSIQSFCAGLGVTENIFIQTIWGILLAKYNNTKDIVFGAVVSGRSAEVKGIEEMIGLFINTIPVRICSKEGETVSSLLKEVQRNAIDGTHHHYTQLAEVQSVSELGRDLFDHILIFENYPVQEMVTNHVTSGELTLMSAVSFEQTNYDLTVVIIPAENIIIRFEYNGNVYDEAVLKGLEDHLVRLIEKIIETPDVEIDAIDYLSAEEKHTLLVTFNDTSVAYPENNTIVELFEKQVAKTPDHIALVFEENELTYDALNKRSDQLADYLGAHYIIEPDDLIGINLQRSEWTIISILGVLKSGAAYVPIDPSYPRERIDYMLADTRCKLVIDEQELNKARSFIASEKNDNKVRPVCKPTNLAYVMYTSGSTGKPKGVMVEHGNVVRLVKSANYIDLTENRTLLATGAVSFDASTFEYWSMLLNGGCLVICRQEVLLDGMRLAKEIEEKKVDTMWFTAGWLNQLVDMHIELFNGLKTVLAGGDKLSSLHINRLIAEYPELEIINGYGPTENTTFSLTYSIRNTVTDIPIGKPISNSSVYILDANGALSPIGIVGEIFVGGAGVARGYLNHSALTEEKFLSNPFTKGGRLYRTGDIGRWLPDGNIEFAGRKDDQVKIRGFRVEPGEIENLLLEYAGISEAVLLAKPGTGKEIELLAYIVSSQPLHVEDLKDYLIKNLPTYMVPAHLIFLKALPLTKNGKVDRNALPPAESSGVKTAKQLPASEWEERLAIIWSNILGRDVIGKKDDFFELGGHSLMIIRLQNYILKEFNVRVQIKDLFSRRTLEQQALLIVNLNTTTFSQITPVPTQINYKPSFSQERLWILSQFKGSNIAYNIAGSYILEGDVSISVLELAFGVIVERHEILRTVFKEDEAGLVKQVVLTTDELHFEIEYENFAEQLEPWDKIRSVLQTDVERPFDLAVGPLLRVKVLQVADNKYILSYIMHHIISDGWSMDILLKELLICYEAFRKGEKSPLVPLRIQYKDYAAWQHEQLSGENISQLKKYWLKQFEGELPVLELPTDKVRPTVKTYNGGQVKKIFDEEVSRGIKRMSHANGCTLFMGLMAGVNALLYRYSNQRDIIIGSPIAGRDHADLEDQIGFYINTLALRSQFKEEDTFSDLLNNVKETTIGAYEHQVYPFDQLVNDLSLKRDTSRSALFDVMLVLQNDGQVENKFPMPGNVSISHYKGNTAEVSKFDLTITFINTSDQLHVYLVYNSDIYSKEFANRMLNHLEQLFSRALLSPDTPINKLDYLDISERDQLLHVFNDTDCLYADQKTIVQLFEDQVLRVGDAPAVVYRNTVLSYEQLNELSNRLANYLIETYKIKADDLVGIRLERSEAMIVSMLGVLKSGAGYVPMDIDHPQERIRYMTQDSGCKVVIDAHFLETFKKKEIQYNSTVPACLNTPEDLAYVMYTSGSTGQPKGVMIEHKAIINYTTWFLKEYNIGDKEASLLLSSFTFDGVLTSVFGCLLSGNTLHVIGKEIVQSPKELASYINRHAVTFLKITPSHLGAMLSGDQSAELFISAQQLKLIIVGGEPINEEDIKTLRTQASHLTLVNHYGPTETTVGVIAGRIKEVAVKIPIGKPIYNTQIYILDAGDMPVPVGVTGEICIGGAGLARGYINKAALTAERFTGHPFKKGERLYRSGDLGRWLPDGKIEFLGRRDGQVKIRGYRIELTEIEHALKRNVKISAAVVTVKQTPGGENELVAYLVAEESLEVADVRADVGLYLPDYMIPSYYVQLDKLPVTINGKLDKKSLPVASEHVRLNASTKYVAPVNEIESKLVAVWEEVLEREKIGINDNFFDLGGTSLKIIKANRKVNLLLNRNDSVTDYFLYPTIYELAKYINDQATENQLSDDVINNAVSNLEDALSAFQKLNGDDAK